MAGRSRINRALKRNELNQPGVYVLTGEGTDGARRLYIGEADVLGDRLKHHVANKEFWTHLVGFTSTNEGLNKAHIRYIESRLIKLARTANQWEVDNATVPADPPLSEADRADAEWFLGEMLVIFPVLGIDAFEVASVSSVSSPSDPLVGGTGLLHLNERGADAKGREAADGFIVLEGSKARIKETPSIPSSLKNLRSQLLERGVLVLEGKALKLTQDYRFSSPSTASGVFVGGASNGLRAWKDASGRTLKSLQEAETSSVTLPLLLD